ncbi:unnamed protein product [Effrenium voratum]|nr:unnamed protein product [Effrenium voratum]
MISRFRRAGLCGHSWRYPGARKAICPWSSIRSFSINLQSSWDSLPSSERDAWQVLELDETAWKRLQSGSTPLRRFEHLTSAQQAAVLYGLRADASEWNSLVERSPEAEERQVAAVPARSSGLVDSIIGGAWHLTKRYGPALGALLASDVARTPSRRSNAPLAAHVVGQLLQQLPWALDLREGPVTVDGLETVLYLDDSASMSGANLSEAQASLRKMAHLLQDSPTRVCTFADVKQVIVPREPRAAPSKQTAVLAGGESPRYFSNKFDHLDPAILCLQWTGRAPGTYMWHMILRKTCYFVLRSSFCSRAISFIFQVSLIWLLVHVWCTRLVWVHSALPAIVLPLSCWKEIRSEGPRVCLLRV